MRKLIWILILLILLAIGVGVYFWLTGSNPLDGNSIPQPPLFPD